MVGASVRPRPLGFCWACFFFWLSYLPPPPPRLPAWRTRRLCSVGVERGGREGGREGGNEIWAKWIWCEARVSARINRQDEASGAAIR